MRWLRIFELTVLIAAAAVAQDTRVVLLGTGNPNPDPERSGPAVAVISGSNAYMVDCGPGVVRRAVQAGISMRQITRLFVTHLHSDHTVGLPDLIFTPAVTGRTEPLEIYGPPGILHMTELIRRAYREDQEIRLNGLEHGLREAYVVHAHDARPGEIYRDAAMRVIAIEVNHGTWPHAYGYRFEAPDKVIVISGDTTYSPRLIAGAKGCDILVHEVYSAKGLQSRTPEWQKYHSTFHTSGADAGRVAAQAQTKTLVLYHQLPMTESAEEVLEEVHQQFPGKVIYGKDLDVIR